MTAGSFARTLRRRAAHRLAAIVLVLFVGGIVVAHHVMPKMATMTAGVACVAVMAMAVGVSVARIARRPEWPTWVTVLVPRTLELVPVAPIRARAGPLHLLLLVLRH